jgi:hypothetical protein
MKLLMDVLSIFELKIKKKCGNINWLGALLADTFKQNESSKKRRGSIIVYSLFEENEHTLFSGEYGSVP